MQIRLHYLRSRSIVIVAAMFCLVTSCATKQQVATAKPKATHYNFVVLFADDLGYGDLSSYGSPNIRTPHLDRMAAEGQKWTNFYVGASVCTPSRGALLTGRLPIRSGLAGAPPNRVFYPDSQRGIPESEITVAEQLKTAGYATACIGKWHLGHKPQYLPTSNGFDYYFGIPYSNDMDNLALANAKSYQDYWGFWNGAPERKDIATFNVPLMRNTEIVERPADQHTITKRYTEEAISFMQQNKEKPFFLYLAYNLPHVPIFASKDFQGKSQGGEYGDTVEEIDWSAGQIMQALRDAGLAENTIVIFTSDNGPWLPMGVEGGSAGLLKDGKGTTWEGGMREPCIFWSPGNISPAIVTDLGTTMDLFPTFCKLAGIDIPKDRIMDGIDLGPVLFENKPGSRNEVYYYRGRELYAVRVGAYKAHLITEGGYGLPAKTSHSTPLLYNLDIDPSERFDVAASHPEVVAQIMEIVEAHHAKMVKGEDQLQYRDTPNR